MEETEAVGLFSSNPSFLLWELFRSELAPGPPPRWPVGGAAELCSRTSGRGYLALTWVMLLSHEALEALGWGAGEGELCSSKGHLGKDTCLVF